MFLLFFAKLEISKRCCLENRVSFAYIISRKRRAALRKKTSEQCFSGKTKPTCQNSAIFEHFENDQKHLGDVLARGPSIGSVHQFLLLWMLLDMRVHALNGHWLFFWPLLKPHPSRFASFVVDIVHLPKQGSFILLAQL